jgi:hypothetical protein
VPEEADTPFGPLGTGATRTGRLAYLLAVAGLVPGLALLLGPAAVLLGLRARRRGRNDPAFTAEGPARAAVLLGSLEAVTNWAGLALMILGWRG